MHGTNPILFFKILFFFHFYKIIKDSVNTIFLWKYFFNCKRQFFLHFEMNQVVQLNVSSDRNMYI